MTSKYLGAYTFVSAELTGTGSAQNVTHGLERTPERVLAFLTGGPASYTQPTITLATHTDDHLVATVTANWKYRLVAFA
jgi:hypothetical protein